MKITNIISRQILDSRGNPTVETDVILNDKYTGRTAVASGASTGTYEALELRDGDPQNYNGQSVLKAVKNVNTIIKESLIGKTDLTQSELDKILIELDGTENKKNLGANAILSVSLAFAWAMSKTQGKMLFEYIGDLYGNSDFILPRPMFNIMNGGKHANWATDIQEYMVIPVSSKSWAQSLQMGGEIYHSLENLLKEKKYSTNVGNEGGFAPNLSNNEEAIDLIISAIGNTKWELGEDIMIGFDAAASEFYDNKTGKYELKRDNISLSSEQMVDYILDLSNKYPVASFEDMLSEDDWSAWTSLTSKIGDKVQIVGDDLLVTNVKKVQKAIDEKACNALLVKPNQIGSLSETLNAMKLSLSARWNNVISHRSAETEDVTIAHLAVGTGCGQIKSGAPSRGERIVKYNELLRIEEYLQSKY